MKVVFVVLHYESLKDTRECVTSMLKYIEEDGAEIVIVDNGSVSGKLNEIEKDYKEILEVELFLWFHNQFHHTSKESTHDFLLDV